MAPLVQHFSVHCGRNRTGRIGGPSPINETRNGPLFLSRQGRGRYDACLQRLTPKVLHPPRKGSNRGLGVFAFLAGAGLSVSTSVLLLCCICNMKEPQMSPCECLKSTNYFVTPTIRQYANERGKNSGHWWLLGLLNVVEGPGADHWERATSPYPK